MEIDWRDQLVTIPATLHTETARIEGRVYSIPGSRLLDVLNGRERPFMAIADVTLTFFQTGEVVSRPFLALHKQAVVCAWPHEEEPQETQVSAD